MSFIPGMRPAPAVSRVPSVAYLESNSSNDAITTYSFSGAALGDDSRDRLVIVSVHTVDTAANSVTTSSTIGGETVAVFNTPYPSGTLPLASQMYARLTPGTVGGPTGTISVVLSASAFRLYSFTHVIYDLISFTPEETHTNNGNPLTLTTTPPANSVIIGAVSTLRTGSTTHSWSGLTESYDTTGQFSNEIYSGGAADGLSAVSATFSSTAAVSATHTGSFTIWR